MTCGGLLVDGGFQINNIIKKGPKIVFQKWAYEVFFCVELMFVLDIVASIAVLSVLKGWSPVFS